MRRCLMVLAGCLGTGVWAAEPAAPLPAVPGAGLVYIVPVRDEIGPPMVYLIRRGVKEAMEARADLLLLDMETPGGRADSTIEIMEILGRFKGQTATYVNNSAYSAGAFIAVATQRIFMAPESVIGAAAPIMMAPGGTGVQEMPNTLEVKTTSALSARVRAYAHKNGHNPAVVEAMIDKQKEFKIDDKVLNEKGSILTLNNREAEARYGDPPKPLLSAGTAETLDDLFRLLGFPAAVRHTVQPTGAERLASWINALNWLWLIIGVAGLYIEFKTPGFGLPGIVGIGAFVLYFLGGYVGGLSGLEWPILFLLGLVLIVLELFVFPGTLVLGFAGVVLVVVTLVMAMVDMYPGMPAMPTLPQLRLPLQNLIYAGLGSAVAVLILSRVLPRTPLYPQLVSQGASGVQTIEAEAQRQQTHLGREGVAVSVLRPGGKAQFGDDLLDVVTQGDLLAKGTRVRIIGHSAREAIVEPVGTSAPSRPA